MILGKTTQKRVITLDMSWTKLMESGGVSGIWIIVAFLASNLISFFGARGASKDKIKSQLLTQTIERQDTLDKQQQRMMENLQDEIKRVKSEMVSIQEEANRQQKRNANLSEKYTTLLQENHSLQNLIINLQHENSELNKTVKRLGEENAEFMKQVKLLTEEIRGKKRPRDENFR